MKKRSSLFFFAAALTLLSRTSFADTIEDVEGQSVGALVSAPFVNNPDAFVRDDTTSTPFGASNKYVEANSRDGGNYFRFLAMNDGAGGSPIEKISFDAYFDTSDFTHLFRFAIRGNETTNSDRVMATYTIQKSAGANQQVGAAGGPVQFDTKHTFDIVANISGSSFSDGTYAVANRTYDLFIDGVLIEDDKALNQNPTKNTKINQIGLWSQGSAGAMTGDPAIESTIYFDNVSFTSLMPVPEPSSLALLGLCGLSLLARRRR